MIDLIAQRRETNGNPYTGKEPVDPAKAAVVVVDVWNGIGCVTSNTIINAQIERMEQVLAAVRRLGGQIVFMPSHVAGQYDGMRQRENIRNVPRYAPPPPPPWSADDEPWPFLADWRKVDTPYYGYERHVLGGAGCNCPRSEANWDGGPYHCNARVGPHRMHPRLTVEAQDLIGEGGRELWNLTQERGITHLVYIGYYTNVCLSHKPFGMYNMNNAGLRCLLVRDLTFPCVPNGWNPYAEPPQLDPSFTLERGFAEVLQFIETRVAGTINSEQLIAAANERKG